MTYVCPLIHRNLAQLVSMHLLSIVIIDFTLCINIASLILCHALLTESLPLYQKLEQ